MGAWAAIRIEAEQGPDLTDGKIINPMRVLKKDPAVTAEKALIAEAAWHGAEHRAAGTETFPGTERVSSAATYLENKANGSSEPNNTH